MGYVIGIDGGGSHVRVAVVTSELRVIGQADGGGINLTSQSFLGAVGELADPIRQALSEAGVTRAQIDAVGVGIAGSETLQTEMTNLIEFVLPSIRVVSASDAEIALIGAFGEKFGTILIAGTGSVAFGVNRLGDSCLVGGWGYRLGDEGSGYWIGLQLLKRYAYALDGRAPNWELKQVIEDTVHLTDRRALVRWMYDRPRVTEIAALAPLALAYPDDTYVADVLDRAADELALAVETVMVQLVNPRDRIAFGGGVLSELNPLTSRLIERLGLSALPIAQHPPVIGAAIMALQAVMINDVD